MKIFLQLSVLFIAITFISCAQAEIKTPLPVAAEPAITESTYIPCLGRNRCDVEDAHNASLDTIRSSKKTLAVSCNGVKLNQKITKKFRSECQTRIETLANEISSKWSTHLSPIDLATITFEDETAYITLVNGVCLEEKSIVARIPLEWIAE